MRSFAFDHFEKPLFLLFLGTLSLVLLVPPTGFSTTFLVTSPEQKIKDSNRVCAAKFISSTTHPTDTQVILTKAKFKKIECFKGNVDETFEVTWPGGTYQDPQTKEVRKTTIAGTPHFEPHQSVILHLWRKSDQSPYTIHTWSQGVIPIQWDKNKNDYVLKKTKTFKDIRRSQKQNKSNVTSFQRDEADVEDAAQTLKMFRAKVKQLLEE